MGLLRKINSFIINLFIFPWDFALFLANLLLPSHKRGHVVPRNSPGHGLKWPAYTPPSPTDSRSPCPMINALANHGILPHDGKNITFPQLNQAIRKAYNFAPSFCFFVPKYAADFMDKSYWRDSFDLEELAKHNAIEHDGSLTRRDAALVPDQGKPDSKLVEEMLACATGTMGEGEGGQGKMLTKKDLSDMLAKRRVDARKTNKEYTESLTHRIFGSANSSTMLTIFGGSISDLTPMLREERFADDWEPRIRNHFGLTMAQFNFTVLPVEFGIDTKKIEKLEKEGKLAVTGGNSQAGGPQAASAPAPGEAVV